MASEVAAVVAAGGTGKRLKTKVHKLFVRIAGRPMLSWTLAALEATRSIGHIVLVVHPDDLPKAKRLVRRERFKKVIRIVPGGASRTESVYRGIQSIPNGIKWVVIHDGARPLVSPKVIQETIQAARRFRAAVTAVPMVPTVKQAKKGWVSKTLDRKTLWVVQTPQTFELELIRRAYARGMKRRILATDDAALVEAMGGRVKIVEGSPVNLKVTNQEDLVIAEAFLKKR